MTRVKIGILSFAHMHAYSYADALAKHPDVEFVGIVDADDTRGRSAAEQFNTKYFTSERELFVQDLDGVIVTSENIHHHTLVALAAQSGVRAILCEKPLATTIDHAKQMISLCAARNVKLATAFPCRYSPAFKQLCTNVWTGAIGDVLAICATNRGSMPGGWFIDKTLAGGAAVIDHTVHVADLNRVLLRTEAETVYAEIHNGFNHEDWEDTGFLSISYANGIVASLDTSWSRPKSYPTWGDVTMQVVGTCGILNLDMFAQNLVHYSAKGKGEWINFGSDTDAGLVSDFIHLASGDDAPHIATGEDGLHALSVAIAAYESAAKGQPAKAHL